MPYTFSGRRNIIKPGKLAVLKLTAIFAFLSLTVINGQNFRFGVFADPVISWFSTDTRETSNDGARAGFNFGFTFNKYFSDNYSFSSGISIMNTGGRLYNADTIEVVFNNFTTEVAAGKSVVYRIQYLSIPLGLKFESNQIGYVTFFADVGIDPKYAIGGKIDIPSESIKGESAENELRKLNLSYHILAGIGYSLGGKTEIVLGLGFEHCFLDATKDLNLQPVDKISDNIIKFRIGVNF
jgi:hypothetical protein